MFRPDVWAEEVLEAERIKKKYNIKEGEILWLLDHWYWPFTEHEVAKWLIST